MSRTRLRQLEQVRSSDTYDDAVEQDSGGATPEAEQQNGPDGYTLDKDLNHIRTQLRKLNNPPYGTDVKWYTDPLGQAIDMFSYSTDTAISAGTAIEVGGNFDPGEPFDLSVFLNGDMLVPSIISAGSLVTEYDYQETDSDGNLVPDGASTEGRQIKINLDIVSGDILQFVWSK